MFQHKQQAIYSEPALSTSSPSSVSSALPYSSHPLTSSHHLTLPASINTTYNESRVLPLPLGMALISKTDVFTPDGSTLLLTAGQKVDATLLARLICFGIKPEQFTLTSNTGHCLSESDTAMLSKTLEAYWQRFDIMIDGQHRAYKNSNASRSDHPLMSMAKVKTKLKTDIIIMDCNKESSAKTSHALKRYGVAPHQLHTVTDMAMLRLSIQSFEPRAVMVEFFQGKGQTHGAQLLCQLREDFPDLKLVLTLNWRSKILHPALVYWLKRLAHIKADVLYKPLQLKTLGAIMNKKDAATLMSPFTANWDAFSSKCTSTVSSS